MITRSRAGMAAARTLSRVVLPVPVAPDTAMAIPAATMASSSLAVAGSRAFRSIRSSSWSRRLAKLRMVTTGPSGASGQHGMEPLAAREAGVDPGAGLVHAEPERGDHALHQGGHGGGRGEADGGPFDGARPLHPDLGGAVDHDVGDQRVGEQGRERAEPGQLVADRAATSVRSGRELDAVLVEGVGHRRPEAGEVARDRAGRGQPALDPLTARAPRRRRAGSADGAGAGVVGCGSGTRRPP